MKLYRLKWRKVQPGDTVKLNGGKWVVAQVVGDKLRESNESFILYSHKEERYIWVSFKRTEEAKVYAESADDLKGRPAQRDYAKLYDPKRGVHYERGSGYDPLPYNNPERYPGETRQQWLDRLSDAGVR